MKISFITTVLDEEKTIEKLLSSLLWQSRKPDEVVISDGGSKDKTVGKIESFKKSHPEINIRTITMKGSNRAKGRNEAIAGATGDIIVVSDAGCELDREWLTNITEPFKNLEIDVVAGFYKPVTENVFQKCLACYTSVMPDKVDPENFLPSSRSIAFRKKVWEAVGGYPDGLDYCEDLVFVKKLKEKNFKFNFTPDALVYWPQGKNFLQAFWQFTNYASGDAEARYWPHLKKIIFVFFRYLLWILVFVFLFRHSFLIAVCYMLITAFIYFSWAIFKNYRYVSHPLTVLYLPILQITADLAVMMGFIRGVFK